MPSLPDEARKVAKDEGVALNQLINVAAADKLSALRTEQTLSARAAGANRPRTIATPARIGQGKQLLAED